MSGGAQGTHAGLDLLIKKNRTKKTGVLKMNLSTAGWVAVGGIAGVVIVLAISFMLVISTNIKNIDRVVKIRIIMV